MSTCSLPDSLPSMPTVVDTHETLDIIADTLTGALVLQATLQLTYDAMGSQQGRIKDSSNGLLFKSKNPLPKDTDINYDSDKEIKSTFVKDGEGKIKKIDKDGKKVKEIEQVDGEGNKVEKEANAADPLDDEDKNPCVEHAYLHKTMMQGGGIEVESIQEPDPRYVRCYERQKVRQKRDELRELCRFNLFVWTMLNPPFREEVDRGYLVVVYDDNEIGGVWF